MPNNDLISRKDALQLATALSEFDEGGWEMKVSAVKVDDLLNIPAVDAEPVRYGKMTVYTLWHTLGWGEIFTKFECCGFEEKGTKKYNFCPNCGAKMGKKE